MIGRADPSPPALRRRIMRGFCLAATVGHAGLLPWLAQRLHVRRDVYHFTSCERTEEQESRVTAGSMGHPVRGSNYYQGDKTRKAIPCSPREQRRADQD